MDWMIKIYNYKFIDLRAQYGIKLPNDSSLRWGGRNLDVIKRIQ